MVTASNAVKAAIEDNWNAGTGGTEPTVYTSAEETMYPSEEEWIFLKTWEYNKKRKRRNDAFVKEDDYVGLRVHTRNHANKEERLDEMVTEIYRIITPANVSGYHKVDIIDQHRRASDKRQNMYIADLLVELKILSTAATAVPGSVASTATIDALLMYGSDNAAYVPLALWGHKLFSYARSSFGYVENLGADDVNMDLVLTQPCTKGSLKLYISNLKFGVKDSDAADYITTVRIHGINENDAVVQMDIDTTNHTSIGDKTFSGAVMPASAMDCSGYQTIIISVACTNSAVTAEMDIGNFRMECYYAA